MEKKPTTSTEFFKERDRRICEEFNARYNPEIHKALPFLKELARKYNLSISRVDQIIKKSSC